MKLLTRSFSWLAAVVVLTTVGARAASTPSEQIRAMLATLHEIGEFNGAILVARNGSVIYRDAFGSEVGALSPNQPDTVWNFASVSKPFTAMAVMMLVERGRMGYNDALTTHLPELGDAGAGLTVRHLLAHTSGIPDVGDLGIDRPGLRESDVLQAVIAEHAKFARPGEKYRYSNTGYLLLGAIVERVAGIPFADFLDRNIFQPLKMDQTRLAVQPGQTKGAGDIFSSVDDLRKWDEALYTERLVRQSTLREAFTPARVREGTTTYGFGWNSAEKDGDTFVWHTGNTGPYRAFIGRRLNEHLLVAILTNQGNSRRPEICDAIVHILHGEPFQPPKLPIAARLADVVKNRGVDQAIEEYRRLKASQPQTFDFSETELNTLGYRLLGQGVLQAGVRIFEFATSEFPQSSNLQDSLGDAYRKSGQKDRAVAAYAKAVELDPHNLNAQRMLKSLQ